MTDEQFYDEAYSILVELGGASENMRGAFVFTLLSEDHKRYGGCFEWRFQGRLGFGGKFWRRTYPDRHDVTCYSEDVTPERADLVNKLNQQLSELDNRRNAQ